jgi:hypothetical protein
MTHELVKKRNDFAAKESMTNQLRDLSPHANKTMETEYSNELGLRQGITHMKLNMQQSF